MPPRDKKLLIVTALAMIMANLVSGPIYQWMIVPRLPSVMHVPMLWWAGMFSPFLGIPLIGAALLSAKSVPIHGLVAALVGPATQNYVRSALTGAPIGHDLFLSSLSLSDIVMDLAFSIATLWIVLTAVIFLAFIIGVKFRDSQPTTTQPA